MSDKKMMQRELLSLINRQSTSEVEIVERYIRLAKTATSLGTDISRLGTILEVVNNGNTYYKTNPAIVELTKVSKEMNNLRAFFDQKREEKNASNEIDLTEFDD